MPLNISTLKNYNPVTDWKRFFNPQFFFTYNDEDEEVENHVLQKVGSYGKQLGILISVLDVLVADLPERAQQQKAVKDFRQLSEQVKGAVAAINGPQQKSITQAYVDRLIENLQSLATSDPKAHRRLVDSSRRPLRQKMRGRQGEASRAALNGASSALIIKRTNAM